MHGIHTNTRTAGIAPNAGPGGPVGLPKVDLGDVWRQLGTPSSQGTAPPLPQWPGIGPLDPGAAGDSPKVSVDDVTDKYMDLYDHDGDDRIAIGSGQQWGSDERIVGGVGNVHTMIQQLREADTDGDHFVTRAELRQSIARWDGDVAVSNTGNGPVTIGDGMLDSSELARFREHAIGQYSRQADSWDDRGVAQTDKVHGADRRNESFDKALPEYLPID